MFQKLLLLPLLGSGLVAPATAQFVPITSTQRPHLDAALCSDASHIAFRAGPQGLGAVHLAGNQEVMLHTSSGAALTSFVWSHNNVDLFFADGNTLARVAVTGGAAVTLAANVAGSELRVCCVDPGASALFGTRRDPIANTTAIWRMPLPMGGQPVDLVTRPGRIDEVGIDGTGNWLLFRSWTGAQPVPATYERYDVAGAAAQVMTTFTVAAASAYWAIAPNVFAVCTLAPGNPQPQVALVDISGQVEFLTDDPWPHTRLFAIDGSHELFHETQSPTGGGTTIASVPNHGGGVMLSHAGQPLVLNGGASTGGLTFDAGETHIAFSAGTSTADPFPQIYLLDMHEDLHIHPHLHVGQTFSIEQHLDLGDIGAVAVADGLAAMPVQVPPLAEEFWLTTAPGRMTVVLSGVGTGTGPLVGVWQIPNQPQLMGVRLFVQAVHFDAALMGEFSRLGYYQVF